MNSVCHAVTRLVVGATIASVAASNNPETLTPTTVIATLVAFAVNFGLHPLEDIPPHADIPHWRKPDPSHPIGWNAKLGPIQYLMALVDLLCAGIITFIGWESLGRNPVIAAGAIGAILPDLTSWGPIINPWLRERTIYRYFHNWHDRIHCRLHYNHRYKGILPQFIAFLIPLALMLWLPLLPGIQIHHLSRAIVSILMVDVISALLAVLLAFLTRFNRESA